MIIGGLKVKVDLFLRVMLILSAWNSYRRIVSIANDNIRNLEKSRMHQEDATGDIYLSSCNDDSQFTSSTRKRFNRTDKKPIFYMHVGPPKMATSTIQSMLQKYGDELKEDNYIFVGKDSEEGWLEKFRNPSYCLMYLVHQNSTCQEDMAERLETYHRKGQNVILSDEVVGIMLSSPDIRATEGMKQLKQLLHKWNVRVLIGYRPYFEYIVSEHNQQYKHSFAKRRLNMWPRNGGRTVPFVRDRWNGKGIAVNGWPTTETMVNAFSSYFEHITPFDIYSEGDLMEYFLCELVEGAYKACVAHKNFVTSYEEQTTKNKAVALDYDMLATAASQKNLVDLSLKRHQVASKVKRHHETQLGLSRLDLPMICPSQERLDILFSASVDIERSVFPGRGERKLMESFNQTLEKKKLCNIDLDKALEDDHWKYFFQSLNATNIVDNK